MDGEQNINAKLTENDVREMHRLSRGGTTAEDLAILFSISVSQVKKILKGLAWKNVYDAECKLRAA
jgi:hypothetical protein